MSANSHRPSRVKGKKCGSTGTTKTRKPWFRLSHLCRPSDPSRGASFRTDGPPTHCPNDRANRVGQPILPARLAEWDKELMHFIRDSKNRCRQDCQHRRLPSDNRPRCPAKRTVAEESQNTILHRMQDFVADLFEQEQWQLVFRVRQGRQVKNYPGKADHRPPIPEHLTHHTLPSCVTHWFLLAPPPTLCHTYNEQVAERLYKHAKTSMIRIGDVANRNATQEAQTCRLTRPTPACQDAPCPSKAAGESKPEAYPRGRTVRRIIRRPSLCTPSS